MSTPITFNFNFGSEQNQSVSNSSQTPTQRDRNLTTLIDSVLATPPDGVRIQFHEMGSVSNSNNTSEYDRGLPFEQLFAHTSIEVVDNNISTDDICSICRNPFTRGDVKRTITSCNHSFHLACIERWFIRQRSCPVCRQVVGTQTTSGSSTNIESSESSVNLSTILSSRSGEL